MDPLSGLTSESRAIIDNFFRWSKLSLDKFKRDLTVEASAFQSGNLWRPTYTKDEVTQMLNGQLAMLLGVVDTQVESTAAASAELIRAVLRQADLQRLTLTVDTMAVLNNAGGVNAMGEHGRQLMSGPTGRLAPLTLAEAGGEAARQLAEANAEVRRLQGKLQQVTDAYTQVMSGRSSDTANLLSMQDAMNDKERLAAELAARCQGQDPTLLSAVQALRSEVAEAKRELATRLNQSTQYQQVKQLLAQRNQQIKSMRQELATYNPAYRQQADDIAAEDD
jgi:leucine zipper transcription factor-like protein 1